MKKPLLTLMALALATFSFAQAGHSADDGHGHAAVTTTTKTDDLLKFKELEHDFGKIPQGKPVYYEFEVVNTGTTPMKLDNVQASCGCTTPEWSKDPIAPGATARIRVGYNASAPDYFEKFISVTYNTDQQKQIKIKGTVWKAPDGSAPANASVDLLKKQTL